MPLSKKIQVKLLLSHLRFSASATLLRLTVIFKTLKTNANFNELHFAHFGAIPGPQMLAKFASITFVPNLCGSSAWTYPILLLTCQRLHNSALFWIDAPISYNFHRLTHLGCWTAHKWVLCLRNCFNLHLLFKFLWHLTLLTALNMLHPLSELPTCACTSCN